MRFVLDARFADDHEFALSLLWREPPDHVTDDEFNAVLASESCAIAYKTWFAFDLALEPHQTPLDMFLERHGATLSHGERAFLEIARNSYVALYEVTDVRLDEGLDLHDFVSGEVIAVRERLATHQLARWDILAARIVPGTSGELVIEAAPFVFPVSCAQELKRALKLARRAQAKGPLAGNDAFLWKTFFVFLAHLWIDRVAFPPLPAFTTTDGDSLAFTKAVFDVSDPARLVQLLGDRDDIDADIDIDADVNGQFVWLEGPGKQNRVLGSFRLEGHRLTFEGLSEARAVRARELVESIAGKIVTYRATRVEDAVQSMKAARSRKAERSRKADAKDRGRSGLPPEVEAKAMQEFLDTHYREWLDIPVPAIGHRTPRHAARLKTQRPRLIELLKMFENHSERDRREGRPTYDTSWLWGELGVERG